ncbi:YcnI family protein [Effusibacillus consociatus]|uniref:YcnI family protein n=1 Tax=Effusibacillus consociatus TaxID=1117041 RepID=A0ABV9Q9I9_9BACL
MIGKKMLSAVIVTSTLLAFAGTASAHVTVWPKESQADSYQRYTVRVPVEKDLNTTKVRLEFPQGVKVSTVMPVPGWNYEFEKDSEGRFTAITWTATDGGIKPNEFMEFGISGKNPKEPGNLAWKAYQTYADGSVVEWTGEPESKTPAPVVTLKEATKKDDPHGEKKESAAGQNKEATTDGTASASSSNTWALILSGAALLVALISLFRKKA